MPRSYEEVETLLVKLEQNMREAKLWSSASPSTNALQSTLPFALDTMSFEQWLQFIFIPKMSEVVNNRSTLPDNLRLLPMAEESFGKKDNYSDLMDVIEHIDLTFKLS